MRARTWLVLVATLLLWSGNWIVARAVRDEISPGLATVGRLIVVLAIQGYDDVYGTMAQLDELASRVKGPCELLSSRTAAMRRFASSRSKPWPPSPGSWRAFEEPR